MQDNRSRRRLNFESLESRLLMARSGVGGFGFPAEYDVTTVEGVRIEGVAVYGAEFTYLDAGDFTQISVGETAVIGTAEVSGTFDGAPIDGSVQIEVLNSDFQIGSDTAGLIAMDATAVGDFTAVITPPSPDPPVNATGDFTARFIGTVDMATANVAGTLDLDILSDDGEIDESFSIPINVTADLFPDQSFTLPDPALASVSGSAWLDVDRNGVRDEAGGEVGRQDIVVELRDADSDTVLATALTNRNGDYSFIDVAAEDYYVAFSGIPKGNQYTTMDVGGDEAVDSDVEADGLTSDFALAVGQYDLNLNAGIVSGSVYQNIFNRHDTDNQNGFSLVDVFKVIDLIRTEGFGVLGVLPTVKQPDELFMDVDGDASFTLVDVFDAIDAARDDIVQAQGGGPSGEGEGALFSMAPPRLDEDLIDWIARGR